MRHSRVNKKIRPVGHRGQILHSHTPCGGETDTRASSQFGLEGPPTARTLARRRRCSIRNDAQAKLDQALKLLREFDELYAGIGFNAEFKERVRRFLRKIDDQA